MRSFIKIIEDAWHDSFRSAAEKHKDVPYIDVALDGGEDTFNQQSPEYISARMEHYQKLFATGSAVLHRIMFLTEEEIASIKPMASLGRCWSYFTGDMSMSALTGNERFYDHDDLGTYLFSARVPISAVDWDGTYEQNARLPWEHEVFLKEGAVIRLTGAWKCADWDTIDASTPKVPIKRELLGRTFRA